MGSARSQCMQAWLLVSGLRWRLLFFIYRYLWFLINSYRDQRLSRAPVRQVRWQPLLSNRSKHEKYLDLNQCHIFTPVAIKTAGLFGPETFSFLRELGCHLKQVTGEPKSFSYLQQRLFVAVQQGNAAAVMGIMGSTTSPFDFFP